MSTIKYWIKTSRPGMSLIGVLAAWIAALLSNGPNWFDPPKVAAGLAMGLCVMGSSLWHYGARHEVYARKHYDLVLVRNPRFMIRVGGMAFLTAFFLAGTLLPHWCAVIIALDIAAIYLYGQGLDLMWPYKNLTIAFVCTTPLVLGWLAGHRLNPILYPMMGCAFLIFGAREMFKDVQDMAANHGKRLTLALDKGEAFALQAGCIVMFLSLPFIGIMAEMTSSPLARQAFLMSIMILGIYCLDLWRTGALPEDYLRPIDLSICIILTGLLMVRAGMY